ncbi:hypothetical protein IJ579_03605 [bacterium]|nr:hypothetical protein [bacterium]
MKKVVIRDYSILFLYFSIFVLLLGIFIAGYPQYNNFMGSYWYLKGVILGVYVIFIVLNSLKEQISYISICDNKFNIQHRKLLKKNILEFDINDIQNCTMYINRGNIRINILLNNNENFNINHNTVTPVLIEKISKISDFINNFDYVICKADYPNNSKIFEKIIKKDKKVILQQRIFSYIISIAIVIIAIILSYAIVN